MKYKLQNSSGHTGEYYVCYRITSDLKCPARLLTSDIGIDGEYELIESDTKISKAKIVRFQVKSQQGIVRNKKSFIINEEHRKYWDNFIEPIIFFLYTSNDCKLYFKLLTPFSFIERDNKLYVELSQNNLYTPQKLKLATIKYEKADFNLLDRIFNLHKEIKNSIHFSRFENIDGLKQKVDKLEVIAHELYWGETFEIENQIDKLNSALNRLDMDADIAAIEDLY